MKYLVLDYRAVEGWENYVVTSCGRVFSRDGKEVSQVLTGEPQYKYVYLRQDKQRKLIRVHRLVALAFLPVVEGKAFVDHIDRDKMNNSASNLRWATASENQRNRDCKWIWTEDDKSNGVIVNRRKTEKELDKEKGQRASARKLGKTLEDYLNRDTRKVIVVNEQEVVYSNVAELCKLYGVSEARVEARMRRKGMTLEEALQAPVERVGKYLYSGNVYTIKELCNVIGIKHRKFIKYKAEYGDKFLDKLKIGHLGIQPYVL